MPEMLRDTVKEDLDVLDNDEANAKKNKAASLALQEEICKFLLKLNKDGLLQFQGSEEVSQDAVGGNTGAAA